ncbi:polysaccharide deacetylase family protein [Bradyrhizobium sp. ISRA443]|uniref:polysaccharide deacetylase family protein n=1 Tax=unclassified Bradyrhizobium TaxID=2631580 RepID=UPI002479D905|nr:MULTISPECIES: polysaccharide deacetylase family protein [unclassified Bradyrhizobium]WGR91740.1 polysaccharide deacetylase family protein [Bradyrhizobium sp. ISRA435]WGS02084.1 polysaccharide deacetylase family protein [Bradyrhizobium sp. ISRA436]WGS08969.1 polysaccharide deacetylase family protein [Bradyrhizobium sp. ISRA437]WGS15858.1 polysaccharide deacetylase family protein [Bradyrhizobium sp. ISRA443]
MFASALARLRKRSSIAAGAALLAALMTQAALAADCPGNPNALGTSRTLVVDPREHPRIGTMQYPETLPLADHEVVLTFDDGPLPKYSNQVLAILASQCIKATFFTIGSQARANPEGVRKLVAAGHTVGTHTQNHPLTMNKMPVDKARQEIDDGIASTLAALNGDKSKLAPFFRIPGLLRATAVEDYLASQGIQVWSADFPADDWRHISPQRVYDLAIQRIEAMGRGILLLHDIQPRTVAALPRILNELKARGYRIVHVVPATPDRPATPTQPQQWYLHPPTETVAISRWPKIPNFIFTATKTLPAPVFSDMDWRDAEVLDHAQHARIGLPSRTQWPQPLLAQAAPVSTLPIPAASVFRIPEARRLTLLAAHHLAPPGTPQAWSARQAKRPKQAVHQPPGAAHGKGPGPSQHAGAPAEPGDPVHVANLKKRSPRAEATAIVKRVPD